METTSKAKSNSKQGKKQNASASLNEDRNLSQKKRPTEEQIREKAREIYNQRLKRGERGTELDDWQKAEKILEGH